MSNALNFAEIVGLRVELLPARTVLSLFSIDNTGPIVADACTTTHTAAMPAVLGLIGGSPEQQTVICQPAAILSSGTPAATSGGASAPAAEATP
ncbi:MAG TPA: hypothetical protein VFA63_09775 [Pseudonocardiaceae bacterium]|jgi:hypothetical protein|nr:hypothetical protein [Pseudonocardiaceae bacterium]